ncbi:MAG TPA: hypothetical protein VHC69_07190 [Polyangiaceae bacterium]|nr:hypothetical protein [Polyangiaceae bacterium]
MKIAKLTAGVFLAVLTAYACGGKSTQSGGSNTNWFATCTSAADCGSGFECWCGICTKTCANDCNANAAAACVAPPPSCNSLPVTDQAMACAVPCAKDADCKSVGTNATCADSICRGAPVVSKNLTCDQLTSRAQDSLQPLRAGADETCTTDADCTEFPGVSCTNACSTVTISKSGLARIQSQIDAVDGSVCAQFKDQGCTVLEPPCAFPGVPGCVKGMCQHVLPGMPVDGGPSSCDSLAQQIGNQIAAVSPLDTSCKVDADCTRVSMPGTCSEPGCLGPVSKAGAAALNAALAQVGGLCSSFTSQGCVPRASGCGAETGDPPQCVQGVCTDVFSTSPPPDAGLSCADLTASMQAELQSVVGSADTKCSNAGDCNVVMLSNACLESCTYVAASQAGAGAIQNELDSIEKNECPAFTRAGCTVTRLPCPAPPTATCMAWCGIP